MKNIKKSCFIIIFIIFLTTLLFSPPVPISPPSSTPVTNNQENRNNAAPDKNKFINDKLEGLKINKYRNENIKNKNSSNEKSNLKDFSVKLEDLQALTNNIKKNIKIINNNENYQIKDEYINIKNTIDKMAIDNVIFLTKIGQEEKQLIKDQNESIIKSMNNLQKLLGEIIKNLDKIKSNEELFNKTIDIEKNIKNINRQYRAIEWILFEQ